MTARLAVILKGYPRLSETFIAQELRGLELAGLEMAFFSMRHPTDTQVHPVHREIEAPVSYLPEYLYREPLRVLRGWWKSRQMPGYRACRNRFFKDFLREPTPNRGRRFGQALVLAAELPRGISHLHAHFLHTPASVTAYTAEIRGLKWTCSAHAKDIWTSKDWDIAEKLTRAEWVVTCTRSGHAHLQNLATQPQRVHLSYHGLNLERFAPRNTDAAHNRDGTDAENPVQLISVCRAVEKKGLDILIDALALLPEDLHWHWTHIGGGSLIKTLRTRAEKAGIAQRLTWLGPQPQTTVLAQYSKSDLFVLPCRITTSGDRDGLPNVIVEAQSQSLPVVSTTVSGVPELIEDGKNGLLVEPEDAAGLAAALNRLAGDPQLRAAMGASGNDIVRRDFSYEQSITTLISLFQRIGIGLDSGG